MAITVEPTDATLGAYVSGIDLARLTDREVDQIKEAFLQYGVLVFLGQHVTEQTQVSFCEQFGRIEHLRQKTAYKASNISNVQRNGTPLSRETFATSLLKGNEGWHTDSSYMPLSAKASCLSALEVPPSGGGTAWADMRTAYDALGSEMKERIADLSALHSLYYSQSVIGHHAKVGSGYGFHTKGAPLRPLVKIHPETQRKALYIGRHAYRIPGMEDSDAKKLLGELLEFACQPPRVYEHRWQPGDMAIWDNRCVLHRARPYDVSEPRSLRHVRIAGEVESESAPTFSDDLVVSQETAA